jgi:hypothetical protein
MAIVDWPTLPSFKPTRMTWGASTPKSAWAGAYTGQTQSLSHFGDRLRVELSLPPCSAADAGAREAYLMSLASTGDWVRLGHFLRPVPAGTMRGGPQIAASAIVGARSITIKNALPGASIMPNAELMNLSPWAVFSGSVTVTANTAAAVNRTQVTADTVNDVDTLAIGYYGISSISVPADGTRYTGSIYVEKSFGGTSTTVAVYISAAGGVNANQCLVNTDTGAILGGVGVVTNSEDNLYWRIAVSTQNAGTSSVTFAVAPAFDFHGLSAGNVAATGFAKFSSAAMHVGPNALPYEVPPSLNGGDVVAVGSQLLVVGYAGAAQGEAQEFTVPLALPLRKAVTTDEPVIWFRPTGNFQLRSDVSALTYLAGRIQDAITLQFVEAF